MPNFAPNSIIYLGNVPFDNSYRHTMTFANATAQAEYFSSVCNRALDNSSYTYVRMNNSIRVPFNAEELYTYDYCMYKNANYGNKWFYAFIIGVNYVNENMTEIVLELDVMQTWYFDYTLVQGFVEREHVNDDTIGAHLNAEPSMDLQYTYFSYSNHIIHPRYACFLVTAVPKYSATGTINPNWGMPGTPNMEVSGSDPVSGGFYQGQFSSAMYLLYDLNDTDSIKTMYRDMQAYNACGAAEAIVDAFTLPFDAFKASDKELLTWATGTYDKRWVLKNDAEIAHSEESIGKPLSLNGYVPKNNKLFVYPYSYLEIGDYSGRTEDLQWEYFNSERAVLYIQMFANADSNGYITPLNYKGVNNQNDNTSYKPFTFNYSNKIPWIYSAYQTWAAQNAVANQLAVIGGLTTMTLSLIPGVVAGSKALGAGMSANDAMFGSMRELKQSNSMLNAKGGFVQNANMVGAGIGAGSIAAVVGNYERMKRVPNETKGNVAGNCKFQAGYTGYYSASVCLKEEYAQIIDNFFSMYGYEVDIVKIPNRTGRRNWNYVKMQNSCHRGNVPADQMDMINKIYDSGITFWHTSDIGNYSLDNSII